MSAGGRRSNVAAGEIVQIGTVEVGLGLVARLEMVSVVDPVLGHFGLEQEEVVGLAGAPV